VVRKAALHLLSEAGYRVFEAGSAAEALGVLATSRQAIDLAIVDVAVTSNPTHDDELSRTRRTST